MPKLAAADIIALVIIVGCFIAIMTGHNSFIEILLLSIAGAYGIGKVGLAVKKRK